MSIIEQNYFLERILKNSKEEEKEIRMNYFYEKDKEKEEILKIQLLLVIYRSAIIEALIYNNAKNYIKQLFLL